MNANTEPINKLNLDSVLESMRGKPVAIAGFGQSSRQMIFDEPEEVQVWGMNAGHDWLDRYDAWFDMHPPGDFDSKPVTDRIDDYLPFLESCSVPVFNQERVDWIENSVRYPFEEVMKLMPLHRINPDEESLHHHTEHYYQTSTITYMIGLAILLEAPSISIYGVDLVDRSDYVMQRAGVEFWLGLAMGKGIEIKLPEQCPLLSGPVYGKEYNNYADSAIARLKEREDRHFSLVVLTNCAIGKADQFANIRKHINVEGGTISPEDWDSVQAQLDQDVTNFLGEINSISGELKEAKRNALIASGVDSMGLHRVQFAQSDRFSFTR